MWLQLEYGSASCPPTLLRPLSPSMGSALWWTLVRMYSVAHTLPRGPRRSTGIVRESQMWPRSPRATAERSPGIQADRDCPGASLLRLSPPRCPGPRALSPPVSGFVQVFTPSKHPLFPLLGGQCYILNLWLCLFPVFPTGIFTGKSA